MGVSNKRDWGLLVAILMPLIALLPTLGDGIVAGADVEVHVHRIHAMALALQEGTLWPRWIPYLHVGYGYPIFNFYAPGYVYATALLEIAGLHITTAYNVMQSAAWMFGSAGMYLLARRFLPAPAALLSVALWAYAPSRLYEVWWQGSLAQIVGASFMPWLLIGVLKNATKPTFRSVLAIALPFAALILSHSPMMYISAIYGALLACAAPIWITRTHFREVLRRWLYIGSGFALGIGLAAIFLMPTLLELRYVIISQGLDETFNYLVEQFLPATEIFTLPRLIDTSDMYLDFPRTLGLVGGILGAFGIIALIVRKRWGLLLALVAGLGFTLFMLLDESLALWLAIPQFENLRFPARLLRMGAVLLALLGGASLLLLPQRWQLRAMGAGLVLVIAQIMPLIKPYDAWLNWENISALDEIYHERDDRTWGTVSYNEFNPIWGEDIYLDVPVYLERYEADPFHMRVLERDIAALNWQGLAGENISSNTLRVTTDEARAVRFRQYYFPGWQATVDGEPAALYADEQLGLITLDLPAGESIVELNYRGTLVQRIATTISIVSAIIAFSLWRIGKPSQVALTEPLALRPAIITTAGIVVAALFTQQVIVPNNWFKLQSAPDDPAYMQARIDATFAEQITLLGYTLHDAAISIENPLDIDLYWRVPQPITDNLTPRVQLLNWTQTAALAVREPILPAAGATSDFDPQRFARDPHTLRLLNPDAPPFVGRISVQMIAPDGSALQLPDGSDRLLLDVPIAINTADDRDLLIDSLNVQYGDVARLHCATITPEGAFYRLDLLWEFLTTPPQELVVMVHGLDAAGDLVVNGDGQPFAGNYPSQHWRTGQILLEERRIEADQVSSIAIGLYRRDDVQRLPATIAGEPLSNNQFVISLSEETTCSQ